LLSLKTGGGTKTQRASNARLFISAIFAQQTHKTSESITTSGVRARKKDEEEIM